MNTLTLDVGRGAVFMPAAMDGRTATKQFRPELPGSSRDVSMVHFNMAMNRKLEYVVDHETSEITVRVLDAETDKLIKVLPPEELQMLNDNPHIADGILFDATA
jgi:flagellar protein FlaG